MNYAQRRNHLSSSINPNHVAVVTNPKNIYYLTGLFSDPHERFMGLLWHESKGWVLILPSLDAEAARRKVDDDIHIISYTDDQPAQEKLFGWLEGLHVTHLWIEEEYMTYDRVIWFTQFNPSITFNSISLLIHKQRVHKSEQEQDILRYLGVLTDRVLQEALTSFHIGMSENDLVAEIEYRAKKAGAEQMSFGTTVLGGEKSAMPHGHSDQTKLESGFVLIDFGLVMQGYCSDMTRTFHIGPWEEERLRLYNLVLQAEKHAIEQARSGMAFGQVDALARTIIDDGGYGEYFIHRLGHGIGLEIHEYPSLHSANKERVENGMVFTIEPGIYIPGLGGIRIEDAVIITEQGAETLTHFPKEADQVLL